MTTVLLPVNRDCKTDAFLVSLVSVTCQQSHSAEVTQAVAGDAEQLCAILIAICMLCRPDSTPKGYPGQAGVTE